MKLQLNCALLTWMFTGIVLWAEPAREHRFGRIQVSQSRFGLLFVLALSNAVPTHLRDYYELFPLEESSNLVDWTVLPTLLRTNSKDTTVTYAERIGGSGGPRFFRTFTNELVTPVPAPDGPYPVGKVSRLVTDSARTNRYVPTNSSFMITIWYPAVAAPGVLPGLYVDPGITRGGSFCAPADYLGMRGHARPDVPIATAEPNYPLVIYSHGHELTRTENTRKVENLASHGFIVVGIDHMNCYRTVFPDGRIFAGRLPPTGGDLELAGRIIATNRLADIRFILGQAALWNSSDELFKNRIHLDKAGILGSSFGGGSSAHACFEEPRIKAGVSLDGGHHLDVIPAFQKPFMILSGDVDDSQSWARPAFRDLYSALSKDAYWVRLIGSGHCDFNESRWFNSPGSAPHIAQSLVQDRLLVAFFQKYLREQDTHYLDKPPADYPNLEFLAK